MAKSSFQNRFQPVVLLPTYNNAHTLLQVLDKASALGLPLMVVNDGATDDTQDILAAWQQANPEKPSRVIRHGKNMGKGAALQTGFKAAACEGYTHVVTMDTDGQLDPEEIPKLAAVARRHPDALILGVRDSHRPDYPASSRTGRGLSNFAIWLESGQQVKDSQCGFRIYPLTRIRSLCVKADRFGYETEIITRAAWAGVAIHEVPVTCRYFTDGTRVSHFKLYRDTVRHIGMHLRLLLLSLISRPRRFRMKNRKTPPSLAD